MSKRSRAANEGSIYKRRDGRWVGVIHVGWLNGKRQRNSYYGRTQHDVVEKMKAPLHNQQRGIPIAFERQTVGEYLRGWLGTLTVRPRTLSRYEEFVRLHIEPTIGRIQLANLNAQQLEALYAEKRKSLSAASVHHLHVVIHEALDKAARQGAVARNVAVLVDPPTVERKEMKVLSRDEARRLLDAVKGTRLEALYTLALAGLRQGELLGLRWKDVNLETGSLSVTHTLQKLGGEFVFAEPKSKSSRRRVSLGETERAALREHRRRQLEEGVVPWQGLVFCSEQGGPIDGKGLLKSFHRLLKRVGLPRVRWHDLRHTAATLMLASGVHQKIVSEMLGHSTTAITMDLYSHVTPTMQAEAARARDALWA
jgi:integrase